MCHLHDSQPAVAGPRGPSPSARLNSVDSFAFHVSHSQLGATTSRASPNASRAASGRQTTMNRTRFHAYMALRIRPREYPAQIMILNCAPSDFGVRSLARVSAHRNRMDRQRYRPRASAFQPTSESLIVAPPNPKTPTPTLDLRPSNLRMDGLQPVDHAPIVAPI
ncbi:hypothetical protein BDN71DRAFT_1455031 [Pleurotus eryngii]|uniref:Uncharacterized protein n=1 Tax=Pleurotus eryngii TaxID=5323 RepID=A0A9P6D3V2_PLEER|nr:hypothetical protein BDN71DRAFT_1455031 [Pleurotus eryngii]